MRGKLEQYLAKQVNFPSSQSWFLENLCSSQQTLCGNLEYGFLNCTGRLNNGALLLWPNNLASRWKGKSLPLSQLLALKHWRSKQVLGRKESQCVAKCFETKSSPLEDVDGRKKPDRKRRKKNISEHMVWRKNTTCHPPPWRPSYSGVFFFTIPLAFQSQEPPVQKVWTISALTFFSGSKLEGSMASLLTAPYKCYFLREKGNSLFFM